MQNNFTSLIIKLTMTIILLTQFQLRCEKMEIAQSEINFIADKIYRNECGRDEKYLVSWNYGEEFASLGIGHFIWYPANQPKVFQESFTELIKFFREKSVELPEWLTKDSLPVCPWQNYEDFKANQGPKYRSLKKLLKKTIDLQTIFIIRRQQESLAKMITAAPDTLHEHIKAQYHRMASSAKGYYPLTDYVNFKGEGVAEKERYNGQGWGLLQVLAEMQGTETGLPAIKEFARSAAMLLNRRIDNSPPERGEARWKNNWNGRVNRYIEDCGGK